MEAGGRSFHVKRSEPNGPDRPGFGRRRPGASSTAPGRTGQGRVAAANAVPPVGYTASDDEIHAAPEIHAVQGVRRGHHGPADMKRAPPPGSDPGAGETARRAYLLSGRVQGVGFRWWTVRAAERLGLRGTVENRPDGSVEIHAVGPADGVRQLEDLLSEGPAAARVERIERIEPAADLPAGFEIKG